MMVGLIDELNFLENLSSILIVRFLVALIILLIGFILAKILGRLLQRVLHEIELNSIIKKISKSNANIEQIIGIFLTYFIYFLTIIIALNQIGLTTTILNMLSAAILIIIIISVFLGIKDSVPNIISGFLIIRKGSIKQGYYIKINDVTGKVDNVTLTEIHLITKKGDIIHIPNSILTKSQYTIRKTKSK